MDGATTNRVPTLGQRLLQFPKTLACPHIRGRRIPGLVFFEDFPQRRFDFRRFLFFAFSPRPGTPDPIRRRIGEFRFQLAPSGHNGLHMHSRDFGQAFLSTMADHDREKPKDRPALVFLASIQ